MSSRTDRQTVGQLMAKRRIRSKSTSRLNSPLNSSMDLTPLSKPRVPPDDRITINVGGTRFQTRKDTLNKIQGSVLQQLAESCKLNEEPDLAYEYFFDRSAAMFENILNFYRVGELHFSHHLCPSEIKRELEFWKLPDSCMADCCWLRYVQYIDKERERQRVHKLLGGSDNTKTLRVGEATAYVYEPAGSLPSLLKDFRKVGASVLHSLLKDLRIANRI